MRIRRCGGQRSRPCARWLSLAARRALLAARPHLRGLEPELGAALAELATSEDVPDLTAAIGNGGPGVRLAALSGLVTAAARTEDPGAMRAALPALVLALRRGGDEGALAALALAASAGSEQPLAGAGVEQAIAGAWATGSTAMRARLPPLLARRSAGVAQLTRALLDTSEPAEVQAAAAWALAGTSSRDGPSGADAGPVRPAIRRWPPTPGPP